MFGFLTKCVWEGRFGSTSRRQNYCNYITGLGWFLKCQILFVFFEHKIFLLGLVYIWSFNHFDFKLSWEVSVNRNIFSSWFLLITPICQGLTSRRNLKKMGYLTT